MTATAAPPEKGAKKKAAAPATAQAAEAPPAAPAQPAATAAAPAPKKHESLDDAILAVMEECPYVQKTGRVGSGKWGYTFASSVDLIAALHPLMVKHRVTLVPVDCDLVKSELYPSKEGTMMNRVIVKVKYQATQADSKDSRPVCTLGEGTDVGDKASPKAMTIAHKYALRQLFNIETGDDPDETPSKELERAADPTVGPMGDSFKRAKHALETAATQAQLDEIRKVYPFKEGRNWNYETHQIEALEAAYTARSKELKGSAPKAG